MRLRWERGKALYYESQVERPAALVAGLPLPKGVLSMRPLGAKETSDARADQPEIVVAQFIVESNGLAAVRFTPPMVGGQAVHQLAVWRIERIKH